MDLGRHPRIGVWAAAAVLAAVPALAGCSADSGPDRGGTTTSAGVPAAPLTAVRAAAPAAPAVDGPADPAAAKAQVEKNWAAFFDSKVSVAKKAELLQNGEFLEPLLSGFAGTTDAAVSSAEVTDVVFTAPTEARVTYDLLLGGIPVLPQTEGTAVLEDGVWKVSAKTLCALVELSGSEDTGLLGVC
ncbi:hypothetical protein [Streptomyces subrutilus]|uniref:Low molecular weight antigen MTB12-like C-terminal domain-containing protein n=1 Tax=Streptomyces subrutilus TaxID=36818 RepID=A0A1E5PP66_9ACTN|nr:hypothetical protein [Streptomyces subrutilus]OEJ31349.1 hypothetical protein BGK67_08315 [Streptomyces subrutilus]